MTATRTARPCGCHDTLVATAAHELRTPLTSLHLRLDLLADPGAVAQILRILLDNALRFAPAGTAVTVTAGRRGRRCELTVADWGPGVAEGDRERIFGRFERAAQTGPDGRFGLGLAIGRDLAHRLGGELCLSSPASPTAFTLELRRWT
jgi:signal transduction histidine kinase